jgi:hypothetical protein
VLQRWANRSQRPRIWRMVPASVARSRHRVLRARRPIDQ